MVDDVMTTSLQINATTIPRLAERWYLSESFKGITSDDGIFIWAIFMIIKRIASIIDFLSCFVSTTSCERADARLPFKVHSPYGGTAVFALVKLNCGIDAIEATIWELAQLHSGDRLRRELPFTESVS